MPNEIHAILSNGIHFVVGILWMCLCIDAIVDHITENWWERNGHLLSSYRIRLSFTFHWSQWSSYILLFMCYQCNSLVLSHTHISSAWKKKLNPRRARNEIQSQPSVSFKANVQTLSYICIALFPPILTINKHHNIKCEYIFFPFFLSFSHSFLSAQHRVACTNFFCTKNIPTKTFNCAGSTWKQLAPSTDRRFILVFICTKVKSDHFSSIKFYFPRKKLKFSLNFFSVVNLGNLIPANVF